MSKYKIKNEFDYFLIEIEDIITDKTTSNVTLNRIEKVLFGKRFLGVVSADEWFHRVDEGEMFIINTDPQNRPGTHWCSVYKYNKTFYVFDSFARDVHALSKFWRSKKNIVNANKGRDESFKSQNCGALSLAYLVIFNRYHEKCLGII